ncbi:MAG: hypothetical protein IPP31_10460 [Chitinophagaceae bacterium]|nr:hypothetical protein [Chitinophagaceae bacterium]
MDHIIQSILPFSQSATELELNVNRSNPAISFYKNNGFSITREEISISATGIMNDYDEERVKLVSLLVFSCSFSFAAACVLSNDEVSPAVLEVKDLAAAWCTEQ